MVEKKESISSAPDVAWWYCYSCLEQCEKLQFQLILRDQSMLPVIFYTLSLKGDWIS